MIVCRCKPDTWRCLRSELDFSAAPEEVALPPAPSPAPTPAPPAVSAAPAALAAPAAAAEANDWDVDEDDGAAKAKLDDSIAALLAQQATQTVQVPHWGGGLRFAHCLK